MLSVVEVCEWPRALETVLMSTPLLISKVAFRCLKLCTVTYFRSCFLQNVLSHSPGVLGYMGVPSHLVNRRSVFCQRSPTFKRSFVCSRLHHLSKSIISSGIFKLRRDCAVFGVPVVIPPFKYCDTLFMVITPVSKSISFHSSPNNSPRRKPVYMARVKKVRYLGSADSSALSKPCASASV